MFSSFGRYIWILFEYQGTRNSWSNRHIQLSKWNESMKEMFSCRTWYLLKFSQNIQGTIIQAPIVRVAILLETIIWGAQLSWEEIVREVIFLGGQLSGGNYPGGNCPRIVFTDKSLKNKRFVWDFKKSLIATDETSS